MLTFIDFCAGIGGFRYGLERAGLKCVGFAEFNEPARASYEAMYDTTDEWTARDINDLKSEDIPYADMWTFGFPCQDISVAGKQKGLAGSRSGLFYKIMDLVRGKKEDERPSILIAENVKHLLKINNGWDFARVLIEMDECGYDVQWQTVNSQDFGVQQSRERVYIVAFLRTKKFSGQKVLPVYQTDRQDKNERVLTEPVAWIGGVKFYHTANPTGRIRSYDKPIWTLATFNIHGVYYPNSNELRMFTPRECFRLQGFPDELFNKAAEVNTDRELYKQAGNAVTTTIPYEIGKKIARLDSVLK